MLCKFCNSKDNTAKDLFCKSCGKIFDKSQLNAFEIFDINAQFTVDFKVLKNKFIELQSACHPDKFIGKDDEQVISIVNSTHVNKCYKTLKTDIKRAELLLDLQNIKIEGAQITDMEFLSNSFEWRESNMEDEVEGEYKLALKKFDEMYSKEEFVAAKDIFLKLKFYKRFLDEVEDAKFS